MDNETVSFGGTGIPESRKPLTVAQQRFADAWLTFQKEPNPKRAVMFELNLSDAMYYKHMANPEIKKYIEERRAKGFDAVEAKFQSDLPQALKLITLEGLLVEYNRLYQVMYEPKDKKAVLDSIRDMRHKFGSDLETEINKLANYTDDEIIVLLMDTVQDLIGQERARNTFRAALRRWDKDNGNKTSKE